MTTKIDGSLRPLFKRHLPQFDWTPIESPMTGGIPDTNACCDGIELWIEFKATATNKVTFRPGQVPWIHKRFRHGGRVWVAVRYRPDPDTDDLLLVYGGHVIELAQSGLRLDPGLVTGRWRGGPRRWPWRPTIAGVLVG